MAEVWRHDQVTVRVVMQAVNAREKRKRAYTTFMTIMIRLADKGVLERRREGRTDVYTARMSAPEYADARARSEVGALIEEFGDVALAHFAAQVARLSPEHRAKLERLATDA